MRDCGICKCLSASSFAEKITDQRPLSFDFWYDSFENNMRGTMCIISRFKEKADNGVRTLILRIDVSIIPQEINK